MIGGLAAQAAGLFGRHRLLRFLVVGAVNTAFGYGTFLAALALMPSTLPALVLATLIAIVFNFVSLGTHVFGSRDPRRIWRFGLTYGLVFGYNAVGLRLFEQAGTAAWLAGLLLLPGGVAISYVANSRFVFSGAGSKSAHAAPAAGHEGGAARPASLSSRAP